MGTDAAFAGRSQPRAGDEDGETSKGNAQGREPHPAAQGRGQGVARVDERYGLLHRGQFTGGKRGEQLLRVSARELGMHRVGKS